MAVAPDNRTFSVWTFGDNDTLAKYSVDDDYWTPVSLNYTWVSNGLRAVTDPTTGLVYIPGGGSNYSAMLVYNPANSSMEELPSSKPLVIVYTIHAPME
ncbi:hypothetical protein BGZ96_000541 [Linnemannia gamsii]|uniref:Uncharacterized protein n=1 Tax=Linnemannia gamsii TaxID=64522 RepID=A0ABQ7JP90_9FUNG|nr:hypothetical protein BGZ96_000541 [Linnemannia gamsii]